MRADSQIGVFRTRPGRFPGLSGRAAGRLLLSFCICSICIAAAALLHWLVVGPWCLYLPWDLSLNSDGSRLVIATGATDSRVVLWDTEKRTAHELARTPQDKTAYQFRFVALHPEQETVASSWARGTTIWNLSGVSRNFIWPERIVQTARTPEIIVGQRELSFCQRGDAVVSMSFSHTDIAAHETSTGKLLWHKEESVTAFASHPANDFLVIAIADQNEPFSKRVQIWNTQDGSVVNELRLSRYLTPSHGVLSVAISSSGRKLAVSCSAGASDPVLLIWNVGSTAKPDRVPVDTSVWRLGFTGDNQLVGGCDHGQIWEWSIPDGKEMWRDQVSKTATAVFVMTVSGDGRVMAAGNGSDRIIVWKRENGVFVRHDEILISDEILSVSPDGWLK